MTAVEPESIRKLLSCNVTSVNQTAAALAIPKIQASRIREQWTRRLTGRCVYCGKPAEDGSCKACGGLEPEDRRPPLDLLRALDPEEVLIHQRCLLCQGTFGIPVGYVLKMIEKHGVFRRPHVCNGCKKKKRIKSHPFDALKA